MSKHQIITFKKYLIILDIIMFIILYIYIILILYENGYYNEVFELYVGGTYHQIISFLKASLPTITFTTEVPLPPPDMRDEEIFFLKCMILVLYIIYVFYM